MASSRQLLSRAVSSLLTSSSRTELGVLAAATASLLHPASLSASELLSTTDTPACATNTRALPLQSHVTWHSMQQQQHHHHHIQQRGMACSAGLGRAPPKVIMIEYDPKDLDAFIQVADAIEEAYPAVVVQGNEDKDGRPGSFEVLTDDGINLYSRLASNVLPGPQDVLQRIASRAKLAVSGADDENKPFCG